MHANLVTLLAAQAAAHPEAPALLAGKGQTPAVYTFAQLHQTIGQGAAYLRALGLQPGARVLVYQPLSWELYVALGAIFHAGLTALFIDPGMARTQVQRAATLLAPQAFLGPPRAHLLRLLIPALRRIPLALTTAAWPLPGARRWDAAAAQTPSTEPAPCHADSPALITATSGSTGAPKFATRSHGFLQRQHAAIAAGLGIGQGDRVATTLPIFALSFLASGATVLLPHVDLRHPGEFDAPALLEHLARRQVTALAASPAFLDKLARTAATQHRSLPTVTRVFTGGAPVFPDLLDQAAQLAPHATICAVYGATEAEPIALLDRRSLSRDQRAALRAGMGLPAGQIVPGIEARVIEDRWGEPLGSLTGAVWDAWQLPPTQAGEIVVAGPHVLTTPTLGAPSPTQICVDDTIWHRTGDAGYFDHQGRLWLLGRCAARLAPKATDVRPRLYPLTVEAAAHAFPEVKHAALVDQRDRRILLLELYDRSLAAAVQQAVAGALRWANLDEVRVLARLPVDRRHNAKIDYPALRRLLEKSR